MNEMSKRFKKIRTEKKLTQEEFAKRLGISRANVANIEYGRVNLTERNIKTVCDIFDVNEEWLRNGTEPTFINKNKSNTEIADLMEKEFDLSPLAKKVVSSYLNLDKQDRVVFERFFTNLLDEISNDDTINLDVKPQLKLIGFGGDNETKELNQEQANLNINNLDIEDNNL